MIYRKLDKFEILLDIDSQNSVHLNGDYSLFSESFNIAYNIKLNKLENLEKFTKKPLKGAFKTDGTVKGDMKFIEIDGKSDVASSDTTYHIELTNLNPTSIIAKMKDGDLPQLLTLAGEKPYADAKLDLDVDFKNIAETK